MVFGTLSYFNNALQKFTGINLILPSPGQKGPFPVLYLLHGLSDDHTVWSRRTKIELYAEGLPLIIVMPDGGRGFYADARAGAAYETSIVRDLVGFIDQTFPTVRSPKGRGLCGNSMGGYGAVRLAVRHPDVFGCAYGHSSAFDFGHSELLRYGDTRTELDRITGGENEGTEFDLFQLLERADRAALPALRFDCGVDDFLIQPNRDLHAHMTKLGIPHQYEEHPGAHDWQYWDKHVQTALAWQCEQFGIAKQ